MKYKAAIFDMDGTILDTIDDIANSVNYSLKKYGFGERTLEDILSFVGNGIHRTLEKSVPPGTADSVVDILFDCYNEHYKVNCAVNTRPFDGIKEVIEELRKAGVYTAVVSNKEDRDAKVLSDMFFGGLFDCVVGRKKNTRRKPYPDSTLDVLSHLGISTREALYIGDSEVDYETAKNASVDVALVTWGFRKESFLSAFEPNYLVKIPNEILKIMLEG